MKIKTEISKLLNREKIFLKQLFLYGVIGGSCSLVDTFCYAFLTRNLGLEKLQSNFISVNIGIFLSFILNTYFNFKKSDRLALRAVSFFAVGYAGLLLSLLILYIGADMLYINDLVVKLFSIVIVALFQFVLNKTVTYSRI